MTRHRTTLRAGIIVTGLLIAIGGARCVNAAAPSTLYQLDSQSSFQQGCFPPCLCAIFEALPVTGTLVLTPGTISGSLETYTITDVNWLIEGAQPQSVTGSGTYEIGGQPVQQRLQLDLLIGQQSVQHFDSGLVPPGAPFPELKATISLHGERCFDTVFVVSASPVGSAQTPTPTASATPTVTPSATTTPTPTMTASPTPSGTPTPTATGSPTATVTPSSVFSPTSTPSPTLSTAPATPTPTVVPSPGTATLDVSPNPLAFGRHKVGSITAKSVVLRAARSNSVPVVVESFSVSSASGDYKLDSGKTTCRPGESLAPKESCEIAIDFTPSAKTRGETDRGQLEILTTATAIKPKPLPVELKGGGSGERK